MKLNRSLALLLLVWSAVLPASQAHAGFFDLLLIGGGGKSWNHGGETPDTYSNTWGAAVLVKDLSFGGKRGGSTSTFSFNPGLGLEAGVFLDTRAFGSGSSLLTLQAIRIPALLWLELNDALWLGAGAHVSRNQSGSADGLEAQHYGLIGAFRVNVFTKSPVGLSLEGRYTRGLTELNAIDPAGSSIRLDSWEGLIGLRLGTI